MTSKTMAAAQTCSADDVLALIKSRRTAGRIHPERLPPREQIERLLEAFTWAPNHKLTQPWRFFIITGEARKAMGDLYRSIVLADAPDSPELRMRADITAKKPLRAPVTIMVVCQTAEGPPRLRKEDYAACAAGVQNMLLLAMSMGLAAKWNTGALIDDEHFKRHYGLPPTAEVVGLVYLGYADGVLPSPPPRRPISELIRWLGDTP